MSKSYYLFSIAVLSLLLLPASVYGQNGYGFSPKQSEYLWPTNAGNYLSSTFAETRSAHFHSALDLKTWGRRGYEVYATRDGIVHRIAIGPKGYGKVIYLKHDDGSYSVYAHLLRFQKEIQQLADSLRIDDYRFEIDRIVENRNIRVEQGELIGLSGASGIGPPHLHFELRTPNHEPFNPLLTNLSIKDTRPPQFSYLSVEPLAITSTVENENRIYTKRGWTSRGEYSFGTVDVSGPVGLGVTVFDQADDVHNAYAVYELKMYVDGELRFHSRADRFSYEETGQMFLDRIYSILQLTGSAFQRLYVADGNSLPFYQPTSKNGKLELSEGEHNIRIIASDFYGNRSVANLQLRVHPEKAFMYTDGGPASGTNGEGEMPSPAVGTTMNPDSWDWFDNWVNIPKQELGHVTVSPLRRQAAGYLGIEGNGTAAIDLRNARDIFFRGSEEDHFIARRVRPDSYSIIPSTTDESYAAFDAGTFYDTLSVGLTVKQLKSDSLKINVIPYSQPIRKSYRLAVAADSLRKGIPKLSIYSYNPQKGKFSYLPTEVKKNHLVSYPDQLGTFFLISDTAAPSISNPKIVKQPDNRWAAVVTVGDNLSGIDHNRSEFYVNGVRGIAELEPEDDRLVYYHPDFTPKTNNHFRVVIYDMEGNRTEKAFELELGQR